MKHRLAGMCVAGRSGGSCFTYESPLECGGSVKPGVPGRGRRDDSAALAVAEIGGGSKMWLCKRGINEKECIAM